jgi:hypothetical protein
MQRKSLVRLLAVAAPVLMALCLVPRFKQFCGESAIYRIGPGLYACEANDEAADDFSCSGSIGGWREALLWRDLSPQECRQVHPDRFVPWMVRLDPFR